MRIHKSILRLPKAASKDPYRPQLTQIEVRRTETGGTEAAATDGKLLAVVRRAEPGPDASALLPRNLLERARKVFGRGPEHLEVSHPKPGTVALSSAGQSVSEDVSRAPTTYPNYSAFVPEPPILHSTPVNPKLLLRAVELIGELSGDCGAGTHTSVTLSVPVEPGAPLRLSYVVEGVECLVLVMPVVVR